MAIAQQQDGVHVDVTVTRMSGEIIDVEASSKDRVEDLMGKVGRTVRIPAAAICLILDGEILESSQLIGDLLEASEEHRETVQIDLAMVILDDSLRSVRKHTSSLLLQVGRMRRPNTYYYPVRESKYERFFSTSRGWCRRRTLKCKGGRTSPAPSSFDLRQLQAERRSWSKLQWSRTGAMIPDTQCGYVCGSQKSETPKRAAFCDDAPSLPLEALDPWHHDCPGGQKQRNLLVQVMEKCRGEKALELMHHLFEAGGDPNSTNEDGNSLFHLACASMDHKLMLEILRHSPKSVCNKRGESYLDAALQVLHIREREWSKKTYYCGDDGYWASLVEACYTVAVSMPLLRKLTRRESRRLALAKAALRLGLFSRVGDEITKSSVVEASDLDPSTVEEGDWEGWPGAFFSFRAAAEGPSSGRKAQKGFEEFAMARRGMLGTLRLTKSPARRSANPETRPLDASDDSSECSTEASRTRTCRLGRPSDPDEEGWMCPKPKSYRRPKQPLALATTPTAPTLAATTVAEATVATAPVAEAILEVATVAAAPTAAAEPEEPHTPRSTISDTSDTSDASDASDAYSYYESYRPYTPIPPEASFACWVPAGCGRRARLQQALVLCSRYGENPYWDTLPTWDSQYTKESRNRKWETHNLNQKEPKEIDAQRRQGRLARKLPKRHCTVKHWKDSSRANSCRDLDLLEEVEMLSH